MKISISKYQIIFIVFAIAIIFLALGFGWKEEVPQEGEVIPGEERITPTGGGGGRASAPIAIPCLVLDEEYCDKGESIYDKDGKFIGLGFNLPKGTKIFNLRC